MSLPLWKHLSLHFLIFLHYHLSPKAFLLNTKSSSHLRNNTFSGPFQPDPHYMATTNLIGNFISRMVNGVWLSKDKELRSGIQSLSKDPQVRGPCLEGIFFETIDDMVGGLVFLVKPYFNSMCMVALKQFPKKMVWCMCAASREVFFFFGGGVDVGKHLYLDNLMKRYWSLVNECTLHKSSNESANHVLIRCNKPWLLGDLLLTISGMHWVFREFVMELFIGWKVHTTGKQQERMMNNSPLFWYIWKVPFIKSFIK